MDSEAIEAKVKQIIMEKLNVEESEIVPSANFIEGTFKNAHKEERHERKGSQRTEQKKFYQISGGHGGVNGHDWRFQC